MSDGIAGKFIVGDGLPQGIPLVSDTGPEMVILPKGAQVYPKLSPFPTEADLRAFIRAEVHQALDDLANELKQSKALRPVAAEHTPSGTCWACREYGKAEEMMWYEHHLIHSTIECVRAAEVKPEQREHRG